MGIEKLLIEVPPMQIQLIDYCPTNYLTFVYELARDVKFITTPSTCPLPDITRGNLPPPLNIRHEDLAHAGDIW